MQNKARRNNRQGLNKAKRDIVQEHQQPSSRFGTLIDLTVEDSVNCENLSVTSVYSRDYQAARKKALRKEIIRKIEESSLASNLEFEEFKNQSFGADSFKNSQTFILSQQNQACPKDRDFDLKGVVIEQSDSLLPSEAVPILFYDTTDLPNTLVSGFEQFSQHDFKPQSKIHYIHDMDGMSKPTLASHFTTTMKATKSQGGKNQCASERLKKQVLDKACELINSASTLPIEYADKEFKKLYRAHKDQMAKSVTFDISQRIGDSEYLEMDEQESASMNVGGGSPNPFGGLSSVNLSFNSSFVNPEDLEMYLSSAQRVAQQNQRGESRSRGGVLNPEEEFEYEE